MYNDNKPQQWSLLRLNLIGYWLQYSSCQFITKFISDATAGFAYTLQVEDHGQIETTIYLPPVIELEHHKGLCSCCESTSGRKSLHWLDALLIFGRALLLIVMMIMHFSSTESSLFYSMNAGNQKYFKTHRSER